MAGIGWRLEYLIRQRSLTGAAAAYATGAAVMALPWVLTTLVLASLPLVLGREAADFAVAELVVDVAYAMSLLVDGPLQVVISRFVADRVYEGRLESIAAPFRRGLGAAFAACSLTTTLVLLALGQPPAVALCGGALAAAVSAQWTALSAGNGLCPTAPILGAVAAGAATSFALAATFVASGCGVRGYLLGLVSGQCLTLGIVLSAIFRALPDAGDESARLLPGIRAYAPLAMAGFAFNASLWVDKLVTTLLAGAAAGRLHGAASTLAWFSTIPCLAWIFVEIETCFHRRFRAFYLALEGGATLREVRGSAGVLERETRRLLRGAAGVQAGVILFLQLAASRWAGLFDLPGGALAPFRLLLVAAAMQSLALLGLILLYYFDLRRDAMWAALSLLVSVAACTSAAAACRLPSSAGTLAGCALGAALTWWRVHRGVGGVLGHTLLDQPFGGELMSGARKDSEGAPRRVQASMRPRRMA